MVRITPHSAQSSRPLKAALALLTFLSIEEVLADPLEIPEVDEVYPVVPDWRNARILQIGDSQLSYAFKREMARRYRAEGARFRMKRWVGSRTKSWIITRRAERLIRAYRPTVVVVTLGTNEMECPQEQYEPWVRELVRHIGARMCYWLGPPPLIEDIRGYNEAMREIVAPCRYFDSRRLDAPIRKDHKFHLTRAQGEAWARLVWRWMNGS